MILEGSPLETVPLESAGAPAAVTITGTGALTLQPISLSGTATVSLTGTAALAFQSLTLLGTGTRTLTGTGSLALQPLTLSGTGTRTLTGTTHCSLGSVSCSGEGTTTPPVPPPPPPAPAGDWVGAGYGRRLWKPEPAPVIGHGSIRLARLAVRGAGTLSLSQSQIDDEEFAELLMLIA